MISVTLKNISLDQTFKYLEELKKSGLVLNQDFEWRYHVAKIVNGIYISKHTEFSFYDEKLATFYTLKWVT